MLTFKTQNQVSGFQGSQTVPFLTGPFTIHQAGCVLSHLPPCSACFLNLYCPSLYLQNTTHSWKFLHKCYFLYKAFLSRTPWTPIKMNHFFNASLQHVYLSYQSCYTYKTCHVWGTELGIHTHTHTAIPSFCSASYLFIYISTLPSTNTVNCKILENRARLFVFFSSYLYPHHVALDMAAEWMNKRLHISSNTECDNDNLII